MTPLDESIGKNPIRNKMSLDAPPVAVDELVQMVAAGRDQFHSYIAKTVKCTYRRPPIYLVDDWVTAALGLFRVSGGVARVRDAALAPDGAAIGPAVMEDFGRLYALFGPLVDLSRALRSLGVLSFDGALDLLWRLARTLPGITEADAREACVADLRANLRKVHDLVRRLFAVVRADRDLASLSREELLVDIGMYVEQFDDELGRFELQRPTALVRGFGPSRHSGVIFEDIPDLDILAPAILLSPCAIAGWSKRVLKTSPLDVASPWLGNTKPKNALLAIALGNVVQHELTHAMVALPSGADIDRAQLDHQWALYRERPDIEEGMANFVAAVVTTNSIVVTERGLRNHQVVDFKKSDQDWGELRDFAVSTFAEDGYASSEAYVRTWERLGCSMGDFGGALHAFSTHAKDTDWHRFMEALHQGRILLANGT